MTPKEGLQVFAISTPGIVPNSRDCAGLPGIPEHHTGVAETSPDPAADASDTRRRPAFWPFNPVRPKCRDTGAEFWCPNGHNLVFRKTEAEKLRDQLAAAKGREDQLRARVTSLDSEVEHQRKRVQGYQGALTKTKKRVGNGLCPCCNRTFKDLAAHMESKHPTYSGEGAP
jgi:hypothetical protein